MDILHLILVLIFGLLRKLADSSTNVLEYGFVWGTIDEDDMEDWDSSNNYGAISDMIDPHKKLLHVHGLTPETEYYTRAYLKDASSDEYHFGANSAEFTTHTIPEIDILHITDISGVFWEGDPHASLPTGLIPGDKFQLAFLTSDTSGATSSNIDDYNNFVQNQWDNSSNLVTPYNDFFGKNISWNCIGSTNDISANENAVVGDITTTPSFRGVYRLDGVKIADGSNTIWNTGLNNFGMACP